jgi:hypothetical protein
MISESVILNVGGKHRLHISEKSYLLTYVPETVGFHLFTYLAPMIQAGFEAGLDPFHFSTGCIFMGMEDSQQLVIIFLKFRRHSFVRFKQQGFVETNPGGLKGHMRKHYTLYN